MLGMRFRRALLYNSNSSSSNRVSFIYITTYKICSPVISLCHNYAKRRGPTKDCMCLCVCVCIFAFIKAPRGYSLDVVLVVCFFPQMKNKTYIIILFAHIYFVFVYSYCCWCCCIPQMPRTLAILYCCCWPSVTIASCVLSLCLL